MLVLEYVARRVALATLVVQYSKDRFKLCLSPEFTAMGNQTADNLNRALAEDFSPYIAARRSRQPELK